MHRHLYFVLRYFILINSCDFVCPLIKWLQLLGLISLKCAAAAAAFPRLYKANYIV
jgi:hypothetical protein